MGGEKRARFVHQQLIGFKGDVTVGETQLFANLVDGGPQRLVPLRIAQFEIIRRELPTPTHFRIHNRLFPTAIGSEFAHLNERLSLVFRQGQSKRANAIHMKSRQDRRQRAADRKCA